MYEILTLIRQRRFVVLKNHRRKKEKMMNNLPLMFHATLGLFFILGTLWIFVDTLNVNENNIARIRALSLGVAVVMWLAYLVGGYWYVLYYTPEKDIILKGPWPFAHDFFMETKEHLVFMIVMLATFLPILASNDFLRSKGVRSLMLWVAGLMIVIGIAMEGAGAIISIGAKIALLPS